MKAATLFSAWVNAQQIFQSTPPVKAATNACGMDDIDLAISIHAAREGGDSPACNAHAGTYISIHAAREGGDCGNE